MKSKVIIIAILIATISLSCSNSVKYSEAFKQETSGKYLYNPDDIIEIYYDGNTLRFKWRGVVMTPVVIDTNEFFVADMYKKLHFVQHPKTKERYLSIIAEDDENKITYDYLKVPNAYKTASTLLKEGDYEKALASYLEIKKQDSTSVFINERDFNSMGYKHIRKQEYDKAIEVLKINVALHPNSANVYDSLAEAYLLNKDSLQAFENYSKTLEINSDNKRAKAYIKAYKNSL